MIIGQNFGFIEVDGACILPDVIGVVNAARKFAEIARFDGVEMAHAQFGRRGYRSEADAFLLTPCPETENTRVHI